MKTRIVWAILVMLLSSPLWGQDSDEKLRTLRTQNLEMEDLFRQIEQLEACIAQASDSLIQIRVSWREACERYLTSGRQTDEDFRYLIGHTDSTFDGIELKKRLEEAYESFRQNGGHEDGSWEEDPEIVDPVSEEDPLEGTDPQEQTDEEVKRVGEEPAGDLKTGDDDSGKFDSPSGLKSSKGSLKSGKKQK